MFKITSLEQCEEIFTLQNKFKDDFGGNIWQTNELYDLISSKKLEGIINCFGKKITAFCIFKRIW